MKRLFPIVLVLAHLVAAGCQSVGVSASDVPLPPPVLATPVDDALVERAAEVVREAAVSQDPARRANAAEAAESLPRDEAAQVIVPMLVDENAVVRFAATLAVGRNRLSGPGVNDKLIELVRGGSPNGRLAAVFALHQLGNTSFSQSLARATRVSDPVVRSHAALTLGLTGDRSATRVLEPLLKDADARVRLTAAEALWQLGSDKGLSPLLGASASGYSDDSVIGTLALGSHPDQRAITSLEGKLSDDYPEVALAAARALGRLGSDRGYVVAVEHADSKLPLRRGLAAAAFGDIGRTDTQPLLDKLLDDENENVQLMAATSILQIARTGGGAAE